MEKGILREFLNFIKVKLCISERNFVFSAEQVSDEFLIYNNVHNPLLLNQVDDGNNNIINTNAVNNNVNPPLGGNNNIINTNSNNINASSYGNNNVINTNSNIINAPLYGNNNINTNSNYINAPLYGNNNQVNMNAPLYGNNNQIDMNAPIFGNSNQVDMNAPIFGNNNQIDMNSPIFGNNNQIDNNMKEPLISNNQNSINNLPINKDNYSINNDEINNAIYDLSLPETNLTYGIRKGNPYVNKEKDKLSERNDLTTRIEGLRKTFWFCCKKSVRAINNLNLGLEANEKFGLLGFNGSGKTTTFRAITNEILFDYGKITLFGHDNKKEFEQIRSRVGYCPQENPLFEFMKVREILDFYSNLKTCFIPYQLICEKFGLTKYLDTFCINLSGGNKRKLTFAIAIMNKPTLLLLDEPSTGVDPESRRFMWKNINELSNSGHQYNMILTTHSMEEAEILCDRVSWLKKGSFVCIGNPEKLKLEYSLGYKLHIKFNDQVISQSRDFLGSGNNMGEAFRDISYLVVGFTKYSSYLLNNAMLEPYIRALIECISKINKYTKKITLIEIGKDLSFELILNIKDQEKQFLFTEILNMKNTDNKISEMIISMESLENILTSFR
jgi:ABC-type multidrug transport system ATPase subunit